MTKSELIELIAAKQSHLPAKDVELAVKQILEIMSDALAQGQRIEIRGFGSFSLHFRPPRQGRNPKTGETVALAGKYVPHFKPGKDLRERVNDPEDEQDARRTSGDISFRRHPARSIDSPRRSRRDPRTRVLDSPRFRARSPTVCPACCVVSPSASSSRSSSCSRMLFTALNQQRFDVDVAFAKFEVSSGLALLIAFAAGLLAGAFARSRWVAELLAERGRLRQALRLAEQRLSGPARPFRSFRPFRPFRPSSPSSPSAQCPLTSSRRSGGRWPARWRSAGASPPGARWCGASAAMRRRARYLEGVRFLLDDKPDRALEVFLSLSEIDDETVDTHFALGSLYRRRGEVDRAIRVHQHIVDRTSLSAGTRDAALTELARDYFRAGLYDRAEELFLTLADSGREPALALVAPGADLRDPARMAAGRQRAQAPAHRSACRSSLPRSRISTARWPRPRSPSRTTRARSSTSTAPRANRTTSAAARILRGDLARGRATPRWRCSSTGASCGATSTCSRWCCRAWPTPRKQAGEPQQFDATLEELVGRAPAIRPRSRTRPSSAATTTIPSSSIACARCSRSTATCAT